MTCSLLLDYYQLSMVEVYLKRGLNSRASFEFFVRRLPEKRNFLIAAGLEQVLDYLEGLSFSKEELEFLEEQGFSGELLDYLSNFSFSGDVWAMAEGTPFFANEPILRVEAPLPQAQLVETRIINILHFQTLIASKAARVAIAAGDRPVIDFGLRRSHEAHAGLYAARACYIGGFTSTATVEAGRLFGIPVTGTMAHSYILAHESEEQAFRNFIEVHPKGPILLIDTFDVEKAARLVTKLFHEYASKGINIRGVRIDSGDLLALSKDVRAILDEKGCKEMKIFVSGGLDETRIEELVGAGAPIDGFGVGTLVDTSADAPFLDCAYKMVEYNGFPRMKFSKGKVTLPFRKQVFRNLDEKGCLKEDVIGVMEKELPGIPLLVKVMEDGRIIRRETLTNMRNRLLEGLASLPTDFKRLDSKATHQPMLAEFLNAFLSKNS